MPVSYSVKLTDAVCISGFAAMQPHYLFSHQRMLASSPMDWVDAGAEFHLGNSTSIAFDLTPYIGKKGLRFHDRSAKLTLAAIKVLLEDTHLLDRDSPDQVNIVVGSDGALQAQMDVVREAMLTPNLVNPKAYPNRGCNVIAGQASLMFGLRGESTVISSGYRSGVDALIYAVRKVIVSDTPTPYIVAAGEGLSEARSLRKKHKSCSGTRYVVPIEGAVALSVERTDSVNTSESDCLYQVVGYQQTHYERTTNPDRHQHVLNYPSTVIDPPAVGTPLKKGDRGNHYPSTATASTTVATPLFKGGRGDQSLTERVHTVHLQTFVNSLHYDLNDIDLVIAGVEDDIVVRTHSDITLLPYDVFGATTLLRMVEAIGLDSSTSAPLPNTIALSESDQHGGTSMVLLQKR